MAIRQSAFYLDFDDSGAWSAADLVSAPFGLSSDIPVVGDWNADEIDEIGVWRPGNRRFFLDNDRSLSWTTGDTMTSPFGLGGDKPLAGNW